MESEIENSINLFNFCVDRRRRSRSRPRSHREYDDHFEENIQPSDARTMLKTNAEAVHSLYGEISTERDGDLTHQCIQTNLADVICGGMFSLSSSLSMREYPFLKSILFGRTQEIPMTKSFMQDHRNAEVHHFQRHAV